MRDARKKPTQPGAGPGTTVAPLFSRRALWLLGALLVLRLLAAVLIVPDIAFDAQGYVESARRLLTTGSFAYPLYTEEFWRQTPDGTLVFRQDARDAFQATPPNAYVLPGYPLFVAAIWGLTGFGGDPGLAVRIAQAFLSVGTAALIYLIARRADERTACLALVLSALYPPFTLANSYLQIEVPYGFLLIAAVYLLLKWYDYRSMSLALAAGAAFGIGMLVRPTVLPWALAAVVTIVLFDRKGRRVRLAQAAAVCMAAAIVLTPWGARNQVLYGEPVLFGTSASVNVVFGLWQDAYDPFVPAWSHPAEHESPAHAEMARMTQDAFERAPQTTSDDLALLAYYRTASRETVRTALSNHAATVVSTRLRTAAASLTWPHAVSPYAYGGVPFTISWILHCALVVFAVVGATRLGRRFDLWLVASLPVYFIAAHAIIFPLWRHYFPTMTFVCVIAAIGVLFCYDSLRARMR